MAARGAPVAAASNDDLSLQARERRHLEEQFVRCWPYLENACDGTVQHEAATVWEKILNQQAHFWPMPNAAAVMVISEHPNGDRELSIWLAGGELQEMQDALPEMEAWGREKGCKRFLVLAPRDWSLAFPGFRKLATVLAKDL